MLETGEALLVRDAALDPRFRPNGIELAGADFCRSYAGTPLITDTQRVVGTFAVLAQAPDQFSPEHLTLLEILGRQVMTRLELYSRIRAQEQAQRAQRRPSAPWPSNAALSPRRWIRFPRWWWYWTPRGASCG